MFNMATKNKKFKENWFFRFLRGFLHTVKRKPYIKNHNEGPLDHGAIIVANHSGAAGPMDLSIFFPYKFVPWGAHQMKEGYKSRWNYAYHTFYRQKMKYGKVRSFILATLLSTINKFLYVNMRLVPTYQDVRFTKTMRESLRFVKDDIPLLIFPEDSNEGYFEEVTRFNNGFAVFADYAYKHHQLNLPIYPVYYAKRRKVIVIGKPLYYADLVNQGLNKSEVAEALRLKVNELYAALPAAKKPKMKKKG